VFWRARERRNVGRYASAESIPRRLNTPVEKVAHRAAGRVSRSEVWRRDEGRCTFVGTSGHRCGSKHQLERHYVHAFAKGGAVTVSNLTLMCSRHNRFAADQDFGAEHMARVVADSRAAVK
jgi:5-methylcytosine-specific restriction endonuclease McrA